MTQDQAAAEQLFVGKGEMAMRMRSCDWSQTPLGAVETWPQSLRSALSICLNSRFPIAIYWGVDSLLLYNDAWRPIVGNKHPWALGRPGREVWSEIWADIGPELAGVLATGEGTFHHDELLSMHRFGYTEECFFEYTFNPIQGQGGLIDGVFNIVTETTYRVLSERRAQLLRETAVKTGVAKTAEESCILMAEALKSDPLDIPFALLYLVDPDGNYARLRGSTELIQDQHSSPEVVDLTVKDGDLWSIAHVAQTAQPQVIDDLGSRFQRIPGSPWLEPPQEAVVLPIVAAGQTKVTGILVAVASPRRRLDDHYRDFFNQIATQIASAITNAQTYEAERKRAEALAELDRAKTTFFSNVSHEFRTPLTLMLSPLEELSATLSGQLQAEQREQLQLIQRNGLRLQKLVNTLLDFSRIEAGRIQASYEPTDLATYTAELASVFRSLIEQAGMKLVLDCPALPEPVYIDRDMWEKIVLNLLSNAFKFTFAGSITVRLRSVDSAVELSIIDTGVGIPEAELPRLFERFYRVSGTKSRTYEGSGIGLSLVQELVKLHGGTIRVTSQVDYGTTFTIVLPLGTAHLPQARIAATRTLTSTALGATPYLAEASRWLPEAGQRKWAIGSGEGLSAPTSYSPLPTAARILLADDNADMRDYVQRVLSQYGEVETVSDGLAALEAIARRLPDLILSDVMMPGLDGLGLLRELRSQPHTKELPIILLSARAGEESRIEGLEAGADDYLVKPFSARELLARVEATLKLGQLRKAAAHQEQVLRAEAQAAKNSLESLLARIGDQFLALDQDWRYIYVNDRVIEVTGLDREELLGKSFWALFPTLVGSPFELEVRRAVAEQMPVQFEYFYPQWNRWFENHVHPSTDGVTMIITDITDRKRAEEQLRESEKFLQAINETAPNLLYIFDLNERRNVYIGPQIFHLLGISPVHVQVLDSQVLVELFHPDDLEPIEQHHNKMRAAREDDIFTIEYRMKHASGKWLWFSSRDTIFVRDPQGNPTQILGSAIDITDRKQAEASLQESEARYRLLAEAIPQLVWTTDATGQNEYVNQRFCDYTGLPAEQLLGLNWLSILHPDDLELTQERWLAAIHSGQFYEIEYRFRGTDGSYRWFLGQGIPLKDEQGQVHKWFGTCTDIEPQKQIEQARLRLLQQEQAAREQAETANRIKDEFLAVLSHELRSPLNPILGWSKLLLSGKLDAAKVTHALETIERNAQLQVQLIDDLLDISRILRGKLVLTVAPVDLSFVISAALETVRLAAEAKSLQIHLSISPSVGKVDGDAGRLQQVAWNLLSNAVKFTPVGGHITIELSAVGTNAQIQVKDTGKGIKPDFLPYIFEHFRQEDGATTRKFGGLGLGLAIARQIVEMHGGRISAASQGEDRGSTFIVELPLLQRTENQGSRTADLTLSTQYSLPGMAQPSLNTPLTGLHILLVDDEPDAREFQAFVLEQGGATVTAATSAFEALQALDQFTPDVLVSDIGMAEMDGYGLIRQVHSRLPQQGRTIPAIALTAYARDIDYQQVIAAGFQVHLTKPVEPEALISAILDLLRGNRAS